MCDIHWAIDNHSVFFVVVIPAVDVKRPRKHPSLLLQAPGSLMISATTNHEFPYFRIAVFPTGHDCQWGSTRMVFLFQTYEIK